MIGHAILPVEGHNHRHALGFLAESWADVLRRVRKYGGDRFTLNQCIIMHAIDSDHLNDMECTVNRLAEAEEMPQQTVSNAIATLRALGLVVEEVHPDDGRVRLLFPTPSALERRNRVWSEAIGIRPLASK